MKLLSSSLALFLALGLVTTFAASGGKEITLRGEGSCRKCNLKQADACQNVLTVEKSGQKTVYVIADTDATKGLHEQVCKAIKPLTVTAVCKKEGDQLVLTASKVEVAK